MSCDYGRDELRSALIQSTVRLSIGSYLARLPEEKAIFEEQIARNKLALKTEASTRPRELNPTYCPPHGAVEARDK